MSTVAAPKRDSRTKFKPKLSFSRSKSSGARSSPSNKKANLPELFDLLTMQRKADEDERRCDVGRNAAEPPVSRRCSKGGLLRTPETTQTDKDEARRSPDSAEPSDRKECEESASEVAENETTFVGAEKSILDETSEPKALGESGVVVRKVRQVHLENDPCEEEDDLLDDLPDSSQALPTLGGTPTAVLRRGSAHRALHDHRHPFVVYHRDIDDEDDERDVSCLVRDGTTAGSRLSRSNPSGRQYAVAADVGHRRARVPVLRAARTARPPRTARARNTRKRRKRDGCSQGWRPRCGSATQKLRSSVCGRPGRAARGYSSSFASKIEKHTPDAVNTTAASTRGRKRPYTAACVRGHRQSTEGVQETTGDSTRHGSFCIGGISTTKSPSPKWRKSRASRPWIRGPGHCPQLMRSSVARQSGRRCQSFFVNSGA
ncbi:uncharacterized protein [Dermacentor albipictus]|uniref:uncharacterized protein n=1 Tax=Dermacentor albipictus TaxID=60249 RepID=UPI0038FC601D